MPELPEVETTRRGIAPQLTNQRIQRLVVRDRRLRWPIPPRLEQRLKGTEILSIERRAKYLLLNTQRGTALMHLGMSGSMRLVFDESAAKIHDHYDIVLENRAILRFNDPRRFGALLWAGRQPEKHPLLASLGPEPFAAAFTGRYLHRLSRGRRVAIKPHIMNARVVVGVGNIYASEALFAAGIHPQRAAGRIALPRMEVLAEQIKAVLTASINAGGTTLRDFHGGDGKPGYYARKLQVYDRAGKACPKCGGAIRQKVLGQRSTYYCVACQS